MSVQSSPMALHVRPRSCGRSKLHRRPAGESNVRFPCRAGEPRSPRTSSSTSCTAHPMQARPRDAGAVCHSNERAKAAGMSLGRTSFVVGGMRGNAVRAGCHSTRKPEIAWMWQKGRQSGGPILTVTWTPTSRRESPVATAKALVGASIARAREHSETDPLELRLVLDGATWGHLPAADRASLPRNSSGGASAVRAASGRLSAGIPVSACASRRRGPDQLRTSMPARRRSRRRTTAGDPAGRWWEEHMGTVANVCWPAQTRSTRTRIRVAQGRLRRVYQLLRDY